MVLRSAAFVLRRYPARSGIFLSCAKTSAADLVVQTTVEQRGAVDWRRNAAFAAFGAGYLGGVQYLLYCRAFPRLFPSAADFAAKPLSLKLVDFRGQAQVLKQVAVDQLVHIPFVYYPAFYLLKACVMAGKCDVELAADALRRYSAVAISDNLAQWSFFLPAAVLNFGFSPLWMRVPIVAGVSFIWTMVLSYRRGDRAENNHTILERRASQARWREIGVRSTGN